jgi:TonB-linked SusC/RagA family outer membrane protein
MMKKLYEKLSMVAVILLTLTSVGLAQERVLTGTIKDESGGVMPGVNVLIKGTTTGTATDVNGKFSISAADNATLVISFIGYVNQEIAVGSRSVIDVAMAADVQVLSEVVVTALGVERSSRVLQSSVTQVSGDNFTQARENSLVNGLAGRVAGVNITKVSSGPAGSTRVVIRGAKSLGSTNNQPLYVIDGVPMDNTNYGQAGVWGGSDAGDGMNSINPDDVASMTVLKGASAAALYGSRAANGVILITTKRGQGKKALGIEFNSNFVTESVINQTDWQQTYGSGGMTGATLATRVATKPTNAATGFNNGWYQQAWGPKMDGSPAVYSDGVTRPYSNAGDNWNRYYQTGSQATNSLAFTAGSETQSFRFSVADLKNNGVIPNSGFDRLNLSLSTNSKFGSKLTIDTKIMYSNENAKNRPNVSDSPGNGVQGLYRVAPDINVLDLRGDPNKPGAIPEGLVMPDGKAPGEEFQTSNNLWSQNPYWAAYQFRNSDTRDRVIASGRARYDITSFLYAQVSAGMDYFTKRGTGLTPQGTGFQRGGAMTEYENRQREVNLEYQVGFNKAFGKVGVNVFVGGNKMTRSNESLSLNGNGFSAPFFAAINNAAQRNYGYGFGEQGINSLFGSAEISYNNYLFVTGTVRKDWFSVLNPANNSILYPSMGASFVFTDAMSSLPSWLSFGKVRASYGQVGAVNSVGPYSTNLTYSLGNTHLGAPLAGYSSGNNLPNPNLVPMLSTETEFGFDIRILQNRLGIDFTYYDQKTTKDILNAPISRGSGFASTSVNLGELTNKGIEVLLTGTAIKNSTLTWDVSLNMSSNRSQVVSLIPGVTSLNVEEPRTRTVFVQQIVGEQWGTLSGYQQTKTADGRLVYDSDGAPITDNKYKILGNSVPTFIGGLNNTFSYKQFRLDFLIDFKAGGNMYSGTNVRMTEAGFHKQTLAGRNGEAPLTVNGAIQTGTNTDGTAIYANFSKTLTPGEAQNYWSQLGERAQERFIYDASFVKLRQITLGYSLPKSILAKTPIQSLSLSFVARNLAVLYKNTDNIDPESGYSSSNGTGLDYFGLPQTRTYGFNLRMTF